jgi:hypothetical protein
MKPHRASLLQITARASLVLTSVFLALLAALHALDPQYNSGHVISEYQLGAYGLLMSLAFCLLGAGVLLLAIALESHLRTKSGRVGRRGLIVIGAMAFIAGVFPPLQIPVIVGYLHGIAGLVVIFGSPIVFTVIGRSLAQGDTPSPFSRLLQWATLVAWVGFLSFFVSLVVAGFAGNTEAPLHPSVSASNRLMIATYWLWLITAAWSLGFRGRE